MRTALTVSEDKIPALYKEPYKASTGIKLKDASEYDIKVIIAYIISLLNISVYNYVNGDQKVLFINFLKNNYPSLTLLELRLAFDYYLTGKIEVKKEHYNKMSLEFFTTVINAYKKQIKTELNKELLKARNEEIRQEIMKDKPTFTDEESYKSILNFINKNNELPIGSPYWIGAYKYAEKTKIINMTNKEKEDFLQSVKEEYLSHDRSHFRNFMLSPEILKNECRKRIIKNHFKKFIKK